MSTSANLVIVSLKGNLKSEFRIAKKVLQLPKGIADKMEKSKLQNSM